MLLVQVMLHIPSYIVSDWTDTMYEGICSITMYNDYNVAIHGPIEVSYVFIEYYKSLQQQTVC